MAKTSNEGYTTKEKSLQYEALNPLLRAMREEFQELSKKKPDGPVSKGKISIANRLLKDVLTVLDSEPNKPYLDLLDEDLLPQNSDVSLILSQYCASMDSFRDKFFRYDREVHGNRWFTK